MTKALLLEAAHLTVDDALGFDEDAAQCQPQLVVRCGLQNIAVSRPFRHDARHAAHIGFVGIVRPEQYARFGIFLPDGARGFDAVAPVHLQIHDDMGGPVLAREFLARRPVFSFQHIAAFRQRRPHGLAEIGAVQRIIFHDQNMHFILRPPGTFPQAGESSHWCRRLPRFS